MKRVLNPIIQFNVLNLAQVFNFPELFHFPNYSSCKSIQCLCCGCNIFFYFSKITFNLFGIFLLVPKPSVSSRLFLFMPLFDWLSCFQVGVTQILVVFFFFFFCHSCSVWDTDKQIKSLGCMNGVQWLVGIPVAERSKLIVLLKDSPTASRDLYLGNIYMAANILEVMLRKRTGGLCVKYFKSRI